MFKKLKVCLLIVASIMLATCACLFMSGCKTGASAEFNLNVSQVGQTQKIEVEWNSERHWDRVTLQVYHGKDLVSEKTISSQSEINQGKAELDAFYGKMKVTIKAQKGNFVGRQTKEVDLFADEYNIAPITATMPVTLFTLSLDKVTNNGEIPTFVWFKRSGAWDWGSLPQNVYAIPVAIGEEFYTSDEEVMYSKTSAWVKELYLINSSSKFNFFYNDYFAYGWVQATICNGIPASNYHVTLLSDGTASYTYYNNHYCKVGADETVDTVAANTEYNKMAAQWSTLKKQVAETGKYARATRNVEIKADDLREYAFVMACEETNVDWWITRISGTMDKNAEMYEKLSQVVTVKDLNASLKAMNDEQKSSLKKLYKFSDTMFEQAEKEGKKAMVILGTWTQYEYEFDAYVKALKTYYGDGFIYYYKGHPRNPTNAVNGKSEHLTSLGLTDVDSTIPAELIIFFNPSIYLSGYATSSFVSVPEGNEDKCCAIFNMTYAAAKETSGMDGYRDKMTMYISVADANNSSYGSLVGSGKTYLIEFKHSETYDIGLYNAETNTIKYYKLNGGAYVEVKA